MTQRASVLWMLAVLLLTAPFAMAANVANVANVANAASEVPASCALATPSSPVSLQTSLGEGVSFTLPGEAALTPLTPAWMPAAGVPACYQTICVNVCFKKGKSCTIAGQTCSCSL
jgi:hypothetical protein